jgi:hypothetical protein
MKCVIVSNRLHFLSYPTAAIRYDRFLMHLNKSSKVKAVFKLEGEREASSGVCDLSLRRWE